MGSQAKRWVFTLNNPTDVEIDAIRHWAEHNPEYFIYGNEVGILNGVPHLQGFFILKRKRRLGQVKSLPGLQRAHFEIARGTNDAASRYCKKDGDYYEFGICPVSEQGKRGDFECLKEWCKGLDHRPTEHEIADAFPGLFGRYAKSCLKFCDLFCPTVPLLPPNAQLRSWQQDLYAALMEPANDRKIIFVVDKEGNMGKSWFIRFMLDRHASETQRLSIGKRDDLAYAIDETKSIFLFDVPREQMEYCQYAVFEQIKDRLIFSPKYESRTKILRKLAHVVVMCNEEPDYGKLSEDRFIVHTL